MPAAMPIMYRRKSDGFRCLMTPAQLADVLGADDFEPLADFTKRDLAPPEADPLDHDADGKKGGSLPKAGK